MENKYTSLEISRLIQNKVPEVETGERYLWLYAHVEYAVENGTDNDKEHPPITAYRLDDVLTCIRVWGDKQGWEEYVCSECGYKVSKYGDGQCLRPDDQPPYCGVVLIDGPHRVSPIYFHCNRLLTAYLADNGFGERCERVIKSIFEEV